eukprot:6641622-Prymnesium_polylepis.1
MAAKCRYLGSDLSLNGNDIWAASRQNLCLGQLGGRYAPRGTTRRCGLAPPRTQQYLVRVHLVTHTKSACLVPSVRNTRLVPSARNTHTRPVGP